MIKKPPSDNEKIKLDSLRKFFSDLPIANEDISSKAAMEWNQNLNNLKYMIANHDPRNFTRWDVIKKTMFLGNAKYVNIELDYLRRHKDWSTRWKPAIMESSIGAPLFYYRYWKSSGNLIHHAYHLARFEDETGQRIDSMSSILEFGGGYGSMCRLAHKLGFKGSYIIFDFPHFSGLQRYYLDSLGFPLRNNNEIAENGIFCINKMEEIARLNITKTQSLFIATWSLSESPISVRQQMTPAIQSCESLLIAFQDDFGEINNLNYFNNEFKIDESKRRHRILKEIQHLPGNSYLFNAPLQ